MRSGRGVCAAVVAAAAIAVCCVSTGPPSARAGDDDDLAHLILFSGRNFWRDGIFAHGGLLWAPDGFDTSGFVLKTLLSAGVYRYNSGALGNITVYGGELKGQFMPGWLFKHGHFELKLFAGIGVEANRLWPDDPGNSLRGLKFGPALAMEFWDEPTTGSMVAADASVSAVAPNYAARVAVGWRAFGQFYIGPETQVYGGDGYRQLRAGAHITSLKTEENEWFAAAGWTIDTENRDSRYVRLGFLQRL